MTKINNVFETRKNAPSLDTLAQLGTNTQNEVLEVAPTTTINDSKRLLKRARRKYFSNHFVIKLAEASKRNPWSTLEKSYWNSYHCNKSLAAFMDGSLLGKYCKNRWCMVCNSIRTAQSINSYVPMISTWGNAAFCTATRPNVKWWELDDEIKELHSIFGQIKDTIKKRNQRGKTPFKLVGVRKFECTYNAIKDTYHPHFHIVFQSKNMAIDFMSEWMKRNPTANRKGQDIRSVDENSLCELFKYMTKVISKTGKGKRVIYADAMDKIFNSMKGKRVMQNFGFKMPKIEEKEVNMISRGMVLDVFEWQQDCADWVGVHSDENLSGYTPSKEFKKFVKTKMIVR